MVEVLVAGIEKARSAEPAAVARAMEGMKFDGKTLGGVHQGTMRAADHQFIQPLYVTMMKRVGSPGVRFDNEGSGYGFRTVRFVDAQKAEQPHSCKMERPADLN
jgi:branched-chain amino acid transport system substrate-binding protein